MPDPRLRVGIIGSDGIPGRYGGFETLAEQLALHLDTTIELIVWCSGIGREVRLKRLNNTSLKYINLSANGISSIPYDLISLFQARHCDVILALGVSGAMFFPVLGKKIVVNIDGLEWKRDKWGRIAKWLLRNFERIAVRSAKVTIGDNVHICDYIAKTYRKPSIMIPYGGALCPDSVAPRLDGYGLTICRVEPENNLHLILEAATMVPEVRFKVIGNWNASSYGQSLKYHYSKHLNLELLDPIYDKTRLHLLRRMCAFYVHGHSAGGTNPSLVEIMHFGKPIIAFEVCYNRATTDSRALYFTTAESLRDKIQQLFHTDEYADMGVSLQNFARDHYQWGPISEQYLAVFQSVGLKPQKVEVLRARSDFQHDSFTDR